MRHSLPTTHFPFLRVLHLPPPRFFFRFISTLRLLSPSVKRLCWWKLYSCADTRISEDTGANAARSVWRPCDFSVAHPFRAIPFFDMFLLSQQTGACAAPCCVTCLTGETKRSGTEASICAWLITHPPPHPPHATHGCTCLRLAAISTPVGISRTVVVTFVSLSPPPAWHPA